jgi:hypothetical protein
MKSIVIEGLSLQADSDGDIRIADKLDAISSSTNSILQLVTGIVEDPIKKSVTPSLPAVPGNLCNEQRRGES